MSLACIISFPGSNCEFDVQEALIKVGFNTKIVFHNQNIPDSTNLVVLPGGFAHGDYLRPGAIAKFSPIINDLLNYHNKGGYILGICNGFQILTELHLLDGALQKNKGLKFLCKDSKLKVHTTNSFVMKHFISEQVVSFPINHFSGSFICEDSTLKKLKENDQILFSYLDNENGSLASIAAITNKSRNVVGLMPHPERASMGPNQDGFAFFSSILDSISTGLTTTKH